MHKTSGRPKAFDEGEVLTSAMNYFLENGYSIVESLKEILE